MVTLEQAIARTKLLRNNWTYNIDQTSVPQEVKEGYLVYCSGLYLKQNVVAALPSVFGEDLSGLKSAGRWVFLKLPTDYLHTMQGGVSAFLVIRTDRKNSAGKALYLYEQLVERSYYER